MYTPNMGSTCEVQVADAAVPEVWNVSSTSLRGAGRRTRLSCLMSRPRVVVCAVRSVGVRVCADCRVACAPLRPEREPCARARARLCARHVRRAAAPAALPAGRASRAGGGVEGRRRARRGFVLRGSCVSRFHKTYYVNDITPRPCAQTPTRTKSQHGPRRAVLYTLCTYYSTDRSVYLTLCTAHAAPRQ